MNNTPTTLLSLGCASTVLGVALYSQEMKLFGYALVVAGIVFLFGFVVAKRKELNEEDR